MNVFKIQKDNVEYEIKTVRLPKVLIQEVQQVADSNDVSFNQVVIQSIEFALANMEQKN